MRQEFVRRLLNVILRALSLASRFVLLFVLARLLEPAQVGLYGLMTATIVFSVLVIGGDYYTYSQRELMGRPREEWSFILQHQLAATALLYVILLPLQGFVFAFDLLPKHFAVWFFALLVSEHLAQELNRLLIAMQRPLTASMILFVRTALWVFAVLPLMWLVPATRQLENVFLGWFVGSLLAVVLSVVIVWKSLPGWRWWPMDWPWLRAGYKTGLIFLAATMCFRALFTADRYIVERLIGTEMLGVYVLYMGMATAIVNFLEPAVFSFLYPRLVSAWRQGSYGAYRRVYKELALSSIIVSLVLAAACAILAPWVLRWTGKTVYLTELPLLWVLLAMAVVYGVGMVPHYGLYARNADRSIIFAHVTSLAIFVLLVSLSAGKWPLFAVPAALIGAFLWMGAVKLWLYLRLKARHRLTVTLSS